MRSLYGPACSVLRRISKRHLRNGPHCGNGLEKIADGSSWSSPFVFVAYKSSGPLPGDRDEDCLRRRQRPGTQFRGSNFHVTRFIKLPSGEEGAEGLDFSSFTDHDLDRVDIIL